MPFLLSIRTVVPRKTDAADQLGLHERSHGTIDERMRRLEVGGILRLRVGLQGLLRLWVEEEVHAREVE